MKKKAKLWVLAAGMVLVVACGPAVDPSAVMPQDGHAAYGGLLTQLRSGELEQADDLFLALRSAGKSSDLLSASELILAMAHMERGEYLLARFYLQEYLKNHPQGAEADYAAFLWIKASFLSVRDPERDQKLMRETLQRARAYYAESSRSAYAPLVSTIITRLEMAEYRLNERIAELYEREGKEAAAAIYRQKNRAYGYDSDAIR